MEISTIQKKVLNLFAKSPLSKDFYWTGGTLLAGLYLHHRESSDLDFFTENPFDYNRVVKFVKSLQEKLNLKEIEEKKIFDRREFFLHNKEKLRIEFVLYEHPALLPRKRHKGILVDSLDDIAANKTITLFDRNDPKDLYDIYFILREKKYMPKKLLTMVEKKFGVSFSESSFWSEPFKALKDLDNLKPLIISKNKKEREKLIKEIKEYFSNQSSDYLRKKLE